VIRQFDTPAAVDRPRGGTFDGNVIWISANSMPSLLYQLDPVTGALLGTLDISAITQSPGGLDWDGVNLWMTDSMQDKIYAVNPATGQLVKTLDAPRYSHPSGVALGEGYLWVSCSHNNEVLKMDPANGLVAASWTVPLAVAVVGDIYALEYFNGAIWVAPYNGSGYNGSRMVFKLRPTDGSVIRSFQGPDEYIMDLAGSGTGQMWMISFGNRKAFLVDLGEVPWLEEDPTSGTVAGGGSQTVTLTLDTVRAGFGVHEAEVHVCSNDPGEPEVLVPVKFTVQPPGDQDSDGDGLLDSVDPDDDNDGMIDVDEAVAGTDPTNRLSVLCIVNSGFRAWNSEFFIRWQSVSNRWYTVQAATNLLTGFNLNL
jgi:hypothetical protein